MSDRALARLSVGLVCALALYQLLILVPAPALAQGSVTIARWVGVTLSAGRLPVLADINNGSQVSPRNNAMTEGAVANDADGSAIYPILTGLNASTAVPAAVSADGDLVRAWGTRNGAAHTISTVGTSGTPSATADSATNVTLMAANTARLALRCTNTSTAVLFLKYGATATTSSFSVQIPAGAYYNAEEPVPTTIVDGIWATDPNTGSAICQELTQ